MFELIKSALELLNKIIRPKEERVKESAVDFIEKAARRQVGREHDAKKSD